ncbi:hypothetical protein BGW38_004938 [Lunasporangiospora selenospora]|uniref:F-box domain-containing protein n=1 Tax=Lunasporangiospora selenospora TaxID=979761 RepID=A0A9P6G091_9FUNG|nr:hypothetical protein BGW38_004938 [Lunasporangiospora selenospora]
MEKALALPEILENIGRFLDIKDLQSCSLVSKLWAKSMKQYLWWTLSIPKVIQTDDLRKVLYKFGHLIRELHINGEVKQDILLEEYCTGLYGLTVKSNYQSDGLIRRSHQTLRSFCHYWEVVQSSSVQSTLFQCPRLEFLFFNSVLLSDTKISSSFVEACTHLTSLTLNMANWDFPEDILMPKSSFLKLERLTVSNYRNLKGLKSNMLDRCPNLKTLVCSQPLGTRFKEFMDVIIATCRRLKVLWVIGGNIPPDDSDVKAVLKALPPMEFIQIRGYPYGKVIERNYASFLHPHHATLRAVELSSRWTSAQIHKLLCSCPNLRAVFGYGTLSADDIGSTSQWVCAKLECFRVRIAAFTVPELSEERRVVFRRLAQLRHLRSLELAALYPINDSVLTSPTYGFQLGEGLELLEPLKMLQQCCLSYLRPGLRKRDVKWMVRAWPSLTSFCAKLNPDDEENERLWKIFHSRGVWDQLSDSRGGPCESVMTKCAIEYADADYQPVQ